MSLNRFKSFILPQVIASQCFGENAELFCVTENTAEGKLHFQSIVQFVDLDMAVGGIRKQFHVVYKFPKGEKITDDFQFFNELLVYTKILPLFSKNVISLFPKFYYGTSKLNQELCDDIIIVENLTPCGYMQSSENIFLNYDHCCLIFKKLGEFHGESLKLKAISPSTFLNDTNQLIETRWVEENYDFCSFFCGENAKRGVVPLLRNGEHVALLTSFMEKLDDVYGMMKEVLKVNELSVLCHGDFCRNNIMFKYEEGKPVDVKFYDLATAKLSSPVIDISFFLFLNVSVELRRTYLKEDFMKKYIEGVQSTAGSLAPSLSELWVEFQQKAVYGYILTSFFLPMVISPTQSKDIKPEVFLRDVEKLREELKINLTRGGETVTNILSDIVRDLINWECLH